MDSEDAKTMAGRVADIRQAMEIVRASRNELQTRMQERRKRMWGAEGDLALKVSWLQERLVIQLQIILSSWDFGLPKLLRRAR
jgi:hypothetical protein